MSGKFTVKNFSVVVPVFNEEDIVLQSAAQIYDICKRKKRTRTSTDKKC